MTEGRVCPDKHGNVGNHHNNLGSSTEVMVKWFIQLALKLGDVCAVRFRKQKKENGVVVKYVDKEQVTFLPANFSWNNLYEQFLLFLEDKHPDLEMPGCSTFQKTLLKRCHNIRIRTPRLNVCDLCSIYKNRMSLAPTVEVTEHMGAHTMDARAMR